MTAAHTPCLIDNWSLECANLNDALPEGSTHDTIHDGLRYYSAVEHTMKADLVFNPARAAVLTHIVPQAKTQSAEYTDDFLGSIDGVMRRKALSTVSHILRVGVLRNLAFPVVLQHITQWSQSQSDILRTTVELRSWPHVRDLRALLSSISSAAYTPGRLAELQDEIREIADALHKDARLLRRLIQCGECPTMAWNATVESCRGRRPSNAFHARR